MLRDREPVPVLRDELPLDRLAVDPALLRGEVERLEPLDDLAAALRLAPPADFARDELARVPLDFDVPREAVLRPPLEPREAEPRLAPLEADEADAPELRELLPLEPSDHLPDITR